MTEARTFQKWRLMLAPPRSGAENMARDTALMERARETGESVFSVYTWTTPTLSLGRNQPARGRYDPDAIRRRGLHVVRRPTGGRALLHHHEVTYSVTAAIADAESLRESYARFNRILIDGLARLGVKAAEASPSSHSPALGDLPCFATPSDGELITNGAKLVGSAQVREGGALLQHGSILIEDDQLIIADLLRTSSPELDSAPASTLQTVLGRTPSVQETAFALFDAVRRMEDPNALPIEDDEVAEATHRHLERYASEWWTWRR